MKTGPETLTKKRIAYVDHKEEFGEPTAKHMRESAQVEYFLSCAALLGRLMASKESSLFDAYAITENGEGLGIACAETIRNNFPFATIILICADSSLFQMKIQQLRITSVIEKVPATLSIGDAILKVLHIIP